MAGTNETITDIIKKIRAEADYIEETARGSLKAGENYDGIAFTESDLESALYLAETKRKEANRLEAALKREMSKNASKNGADFGQLGDCAKLREALVYLIQNESTLFEANLTGGELELLHLITNKARAALAATEKGGGAI